MKRLNLKIINMLKKRQSNIIGADKRALYEEMLDEIIHFLNDNDWQTDGISEPTREDMLFDLDLDQSSPTTQEEALMLFYYKLGWNRGTHRMTG